MELNCWIHRFFGGWSRLLNKVGEISNSLREPSDGPGIDQGNENVIWWWWKWRGVLAKCVLKCFDIVREENASATAAQACATKHIVLATPPFSSSSSYSSFTTSMMACCLVHSSWFSSFTTFPPPADHQLLLPLYITHRSFGNKQI